MAVVWTCLVQSVCYWNLHCLPCFTTPIKIYTLHTDFLDVPGNCYEGKVFNVYKSMKILEI